MSIIPQCNEFTTMATMMNGLDTIPSHCDKASVTLTVAMVAKLLDWANSMASPEDIYKAVENMTSQNLAGIIDIDAWSSIVPNCDNEDEEVVVEPTIEEEPTSVEVEQVSDEVEDGIENTVASDDCQNCVIDLFDETETDGQEALRNYQAKFNIVPDEPTIDNPVIDDSISPDLEQEILKVLANC